MQEISKPEKKTYYYIKNPEGTVLQEGWVNPNQVLGTPDTNTIHYSDNKLDVIPHMEADLGPQTAFNDLLTTDEVNGDIFGVETEKKKTLFLYLLDPLWQNHYLGLCIK